MNPDLATYLTKNAQFINQLYKDGYELQIRKGAMVKIITYSSKTDFTVEVKQRVYLNEYIMHWGENTNILLCQGLTYRSPVSTEELAENYVIKGIVDFQQNKIPKYDKGDKPVNYLKSKYQLTEPEFIKQLELCRDCWEPYIAEKYKEGYRLNVRIEKTPNMFIYRIKPQYQCFMQSERHLTVLINNKMVSFPNQLVATECVKRYELIRKSGDSENLILFSCLGLASYYDRYLAMYYNREG